MNTGTQKWLKLSRHILGCEGKVVLSCMVYILLGIDGHMAVGYLHYSKLNVRVLDTRHKNKSKELGNAYSTVQV